MYRGVESLQSMLSFGKDGVAELPVAQPEAGAGFPYVTARPTRAPWCGVCTPILRLFERRGESSDERDRKATLFLLAVTALLTQVCIHATFELAGPLVWTQTALNLFVSFAVLTVVAVTKHAGTALYVAALAAWTVCLILTDWRLASGLGERLPIMFAVVLDLLLVGHVPSKISVVFVGVIVAWFTVLQVERVYRVGVLDVAGTVDVSDRQAVCGCEHPPCGGGRGTDLLVAVPAVAAVLLDYWLTRRFADEMERKSAAVAAACDTADRVAMCLANFDLDAAAEHLDAPDAALPQSLRTTLETLLNNLSSYRPYLPPALFPAPDAIAKGSSENMSPGSIQVPGRASRHVAMMFTDIRQSTALWEHCPEPMRLALAVHNHIIRASLAQFNGYEVKTIGDAFMVAFEQPLDAVRAGRDIQVAFANKDIWHPALTRGDAVESDGHRIFSARIGVHCGDVVVERNVLTGRYDYFGSTVNKAARVEAKGIASAVTVTNEVMERVEEIFDLFYVIPYAEGTAVKGFAALLRLTALLPRSRECAELEDLVRRQAAGTFGDASPSPRTGRHLGRNSLAFVPNSAGTGRGYDNKCLSAIARRLMAESFCGSDSDASSSDDDSMVEQSDRLTHVPTHYTQGATSMCSERDQGNSGRMRLTDVSSSGHTIASRRHLLSSYTAPNAATVAAASGVAQSHQVSASVGVVRFDFYGDAQTFEVQWQSMEGSATDRLAMLHACTTDTSGTLWCVIGGTAVATWGLTSPTAQYLNLSARAMVQLHDSWITDILADDYVAPPCHFYAGLASGRMLRGSLSASPNQYFVTPLGPCVDLGLMLCTAAAELGANVLVASYGCRAKHSYAANPTLLPYLRPVDVWSFSPDEGNAWASWEGIGRMVRSECQLDESQPSLASAQSPTRTDAVALQLPSKLQEKVGGAAQPVQAQAAPAPALTFGARTISPTPSVRAVTTPPENAASVISPRGSDVMRMISLRQKGTAAGANPQLETRKSVVVLQLAVGQLHTSAEPPQLAREWSLSKFTSEHTLNTSEGVTPTISQLSAAVQSSATTTSGTNAPAPPPATWGSAFARLYLTNDTIAVNMLALQHPEDTVLARVALLLEAGAHLPHGFLKFPAAMGGEAAAAAAAAATVASPVGAF